MTLYHILILTSSVHAAGIPSAVLQIPLHFEQNKGQAPERIKYLSRGPGYSVLLEGSGATLQLPDAAIRMRLNRANRHPAISSEKELEGKVSYFRGDDPSRWTKGAPTFERVRYSAVYAGIDLVYHGRQQQLEYDFEVSPGANPRTIEFQFDGAKRLRIDSNGDLILATRDGELRQHKPEVYQLIGGKRKQIEGRYVLRSGKRVGFDVANYDISRSLVIDPVLSYGTYIGGWGTDTPQALAVDAQGNLYITGSTTSPNFPATGGAYKTTCGPDGNCNNGNTDAFVLKLNPTGTALVYSTFLGGTANDSGLGIALDGANNAYVYGSTSSADFPASAGTIGYSNRGSYFLVKLDSTGSTLIYSAFPQLVSTYSGRWQFAVNSSGNAFLAGTLSALPLLATTQGAFQAEPGGGLDGFVIGIDATATSLLYATYLGGNGDDVINGLSVDDTNAVYVAGSTTSSNLPVTSDAFQAAIGGVRSDGFFIKLQPDGAGVRYGTYIGGTAQDWIAAIVHDKSGNIYLSGSTFSSNYPVTPGAMSAHPRDALDSVGILAKFTSSGSLVYSATVPVYGNSLYEVSPSIGVDDAGNLYYTASNGYSCGIGKVNASASAILWSAMIPSCQIELPLSGSANLTVDGSGNVYGVASFGRTTSGAFMATGPGNGFYVFKLESSGSTAIAVFPPALNLFAPANIDYFNNGALSAYTVGASVPVASSTSIAPSTVPWIKYENFSPLSAIDSLPPTNINYYNYIYSMPPGSYTTNMIITAPGADNSPLSVPISLTVTTSPAISLSASALIFYFSPAASATSQTQNFSVNTFNGSSAYTASSTSSGWLSVFDKGSGTVSAIASGANLSPGVYDGSIIITSPGKLGSPATVAVKLVVMQASIFADAKSLSFVMPMGSVGTSSRTVRVVSFPNGLAYKATAASSGWLSVVAPTGISPEKIAVSVNSAGLASGTYNGAVSIMSADGSTLTVIPVLLTIVASPINVSQSSLTFNFKKGVIGTQSQQLLFTADPNIYYTITSGASWLTVSPAGASGTTSIVLTSNPGSLAPGSYIVRIQVTSPTASNTPFSIQATMNIIAGPILVNPASLTFIQKKGASNAKPQELHFTADPGVSYSLTSTASWISSGLSVATGSVTLYVYPSAWLLAAGTYNATITVSSQGASNTPISIPVTFTINPLSAADLNFMPASLSFFWQTGSATPASQTVNATFDSVSGSVSATAASSGWLVVTPSGNGSDFKVSINTSGLTPGSYNGAVIVSANGAGSKILPVTLTVTVTEPSQFFLGTDKLSFSSKLGAGSPPSQLLVVMAKGNHFNFNATANSSGGWLSIDASSGKTPANINVSVNPAGHLPGSYTGSVVLASLDAANNPISVPITLTVSNSTTVVVNAASLLPEPVSPGSIVTVSGNFQITTIALAQDVPFVPLPTTLAGLSVKVNGIAAPLFYVSPKQINLQLPPSVTPGDASMIVSVAGVDSAPTSFIVAVAAPAIFANSEKHGVIRNPDGRLNGKANPAAEGSVIVVFFTGIGPVDRDLAPGVAAPRDKPVNGTMPLTAILGGKPCEVLFSGLAPSSVGQALANLRVPQGLATGDQKLTLTIGGVTSDWVWVAVN